ncbi:hypothetical protein LR48_Vigan04g099300 [Vigna angularis]|uniref:Uncharacterized protein n=1 Tax=Phaseolus angularis TaxID=3914 RepID=A0A0L9UCZ1_PHAAN|nr:hypothetical protein LR48_Vigan04g099300 [Vigna angularis]
MLDKFWDIWRLNEKWKLVPKKEVHEDGVAGPTIFIHASSVRPTAWRECPAYTHSFQREGRRLHFPAKKRTSSRKKAAASIQRTSKSKHTHLKRSGHRASSLLHPEGSPAATGVQQPSRSRTTASEATVQHKTARPGNGKGSSRMRGFTCPAAENSTVQREGGAQVQVGVHTGSQQRGGIQQLAVHASCNLGRSGARGLNWGGAWREMDSRSNRARGFITLEAAATHTQFLVFFFGALERCCTEIEKEVMIW